MSGRAQHLRIVEALLFAAAEPMTLDDLRARLPEVDLPDLLGELADHYRDRGVNLVERGGRWAFRTAPDLTAALAEPAAPLNRVSRAAVETLAIIAYRQPITRAEIEAVRGVATSKGTLDQLIEAGWIQPGKRKEAPGRPLTWITTPAFLDHFGLSSLMALPSLEELRSAGFLSGAPTIVMTPQTTVLDDREEDEAGAG